MVSFGLTLRTFIIGSLLSVVATAAVSATIVDSGANPNGFPFDFGINQYFAGQFTITGPTVITSSEGYFSNDRDGQAGTVSIGLYSNGANTPGVLLHSQSIGLAKDAGLGWYGVTGVNWLLDAGTYWASFVPSAAISGIMPGDAPSPLAEYAVGSFDGYFIAPQDTFDFVKIGIRVSGDTSAVAVPGPLAGAGLIPLLGFAGAWFARRRVHPRNFA